MPILSFSTDTIGEVGIIPRTVRIDTNDNFATITGANYLRPIVKMGFPLANTDAVLVSYVGPTGIPITELFNVNITSSTITLVAAASGTILPVTNGHFANFSGTNGQIADDGYIPSNASLTNVSMVSGATTVNTVPKFADTTGTVTNGYTPSNASLQFVSTNAGSLQTGNIPEFADANGTLTGTNLVANEVLFCSFPFPDTNGNIVYYTSPVSHTFLASGGTVLLMPTPQVNAAYKIINIRIAATTGAGGINFSGGDRNLAIACNGVAYSTIPAATLQALTNAVWGSTAVPYPTVTFPDFSTSVGQPIVALYTGGTTDYTAGSITISIHLIRIS